MRRTALLFFTPILVSPIIAQAADGPIRKAGEWSLTMTYPGAPSTTSKVCFQSDTPLSTFSAKQTERCSKRDVSVTDNIVTMDLTCAKPNKTIVTVQATITAYDDAFHTENKMHSESGSDQSEDTAFSIDAKRLGPCQADDFNGD
jgi:hypothetical protein